ncbi:MAG: sensor domain-containing diguanylate cyclase [Acidobacteria bacterium]|nr:MAG: sensor domain-containing diguanylate cyclase [Acidobacteriota bacterium]
MRLRSASEWMAVSAGVLGTLVLVGYAMRSTVLAQLQPWHNATIVPGSAISLILGALALLFVKRWRTIFALLLLALNLEMLLEIAFGLNLRLKLAENYLWLQGPGVVPDRISLLVNIGFLLLGVAVLLLLWAPRRSAWVLRWLTWLVVAIGIASVLTPYLRLDLIYEFHALTRPAQLSGLGMLLLGLALWLACRDCRWNRPAAGYEQASRILSAATLALVVVLAVAAFSGLLMMRRLAERGAMDNLTLRRDERINYVRLLIQEAVARGRAYAQDAALVAAVQHPNGAMARLRPPQDFSSVTVYRGQRKLWEYGTPVQSPEASVPLPLSSPAKLLWEGEFFLRQRLPVMAPNQQNQVLGTVVIEQPRPLLGTIGMESAAFGSSGEVALCGLPSLDSATLACFPTRLRQQPYQRPDSDSGDGSAHPMALALAGKAGIVDTIDYRGVRVLAAYAPVPGMGLALMVKMDTQELYAPIRDEINILGPVLLLLAVLGIQLLRWRVQPVVSALVASRNQVASSEARFRAAAESGMDPFYIFETVRSAVTGGISNFRLIYANQPGETFAGIEPGRGEILGLASVPQLQATGDVLSKLQAVVMRRQHWVEEFAVPGRKTANGPQWLYLQAVPLGDGVAVTLRDISERKWEEDRLRVMAQTDALTGLANRDAFRKRLAHAMASSRRLRRQALLAVLYLDIDYFKDINDTYGHTFGDRILQAFAARLQRSVRSADTVARPGGDEFAILLENMESTQDAERVVAAIFAALEDPIHIGSHQVRISTSIGLTYYRGEACDLEELVQQADAALYMAKRSGKNTWRQFAERGNLETP